MRGMAVKTSMMSLFMICACFAQFQRARVVDRNDLPLSVQRVAGHVFLVTDFNFRRTQALFYAHPEGILFFDTTWQAKTAEQLIWKAAAYSLEDYVGVIVTGPQLERTAGLSAFRGHEIPIYMQTKAPRILAGNWNKEIQEMQQTFSSFQEAIFIRPDFTVQRTASLLSERVTLLELEESQKDGHLLAFFREERLLYTGGLVLPAHERSKLIDALRPHVIIEAGRVEKIKRAQ